MTSCISRLPVCQIRFSCFEMKSQQVAFTEYNKRFNVLFPLVISFPVLEIGQSGFRGLVNFGAQLFDKRLKTCHTAQFLHKIQACVTNLVSCNVHFLIFEVKLIKLFVELRVLSSSLLPYEQREYLQHSRV